MYDDDFFKQPVSVVIVGLRKSGCSLQQHLPNMTYRPGWI